jgi:hypothetical protein
MFISNLYDKGRQVSLEISIESILTCVEILQNA